MGQSDHCIIILIMVILNLVDCDRHQLVGKEIRRSATFFATLESKHLTPDIENRFAQSENSFAPKQFRPVAAGLRDTGDRVTLLRNHRRRSNSRTICPPLRHADRSGGRRCRVLHRKRILDRPELRNLRIRTFVPVKACLAHLPSVHRSIPVLHRHRRPARRRRPRCTADHELGNDLFAHSNTANSTAAARFRGPTLSIAQWIDVDDRL